MPTIRILVVDDHEIVRRAICSLLHSQPDLQVIGEASDGLEAVKRAEEEHPDLVVLDIRMPELSGLEAARRIRQVAPGTAVLVLREHEYSEGVQGALQQG